MMLAKLREYLCQPGSNWRFVVLMVGNLAGSQSGGVWVEPMFYDDALVAGRIGVDEDRFRLLPDDDVTMQAG